MDKRIAFIPNLRAHALLEHFFVSAVAAILLVRLYLYLTGFPQVGGKGLHISHMLWGGLLMLVAIIMLLYFLDRTAQGIAAILGGAGLGVFIDEVGKFITSNNNYFFKPAVAIIYIVFVLLYLLFLYLERRRTTSESAYMVNALHELQAALLHDESVRHHARAHSYLEQCDRSSRAYAALSALSEAIALEVDRRRPGRVRRLWLALRWSTHRLMHRRAFQTMILGALLLQTVGTLAQTIASVTIANGHHGPTQPTTRLSFDEIAALLSSVIADAVVLIGVLSVPRSRLAAYRLFKIGMLISILVTQIFVFSLVQFWALIAFGVDVVILITLNVLIRHEETRRLLPHTAVPALPGQVAAPGQL